MPVSSASPNACLRDCDLREPLFLTVDAPLQEAARRMRESDVSCLLIGTPGDVVAVITERDIVAAAAQGDGPDAPAIQCSSHERLTVSLDATVRHAAALMMHYGIRHLIVADEQRAVGVISMRDALSSLVRSSPESLVAMVHQALEPHSESWLG